MTITATVNSTLVETLSNIFSNITWFVLIYWAVKTISREIKATTKEVPSWIDKYEQIQIKKRAIDNARRGMG